MPLLAMRKCIRASLRQLATLLAYIERLPERCRRALLV